MHSATLDSTNMIIRLVLAAACGGLIGLERERLERAAGLRTHALVAVASALIMIVSTYGFPTSIDGTPMSLDPSRIAAQVVSGIGFLGAGVIILRDNAVRGLTTAATIWAVAGLGLACGSGLYVPAVAATMLMLAIQAGLKPVERRVFRHHALRQRVLVETRSPNAVIGELDVALSNSQVRLHSLQFDRREETGIDLVELNLITDTPDVISEIVSRLQACPDVQRVIYRTGSEQPRTATNRRILPGLRRRAS